MKLSKSLLSAVMIGLTMGITTSCSKVNIGPDDKDHVCEQPCETEGCGFGETVKSDPCPACGMG